MRLEFDVGSCVRMRRDARAHDVSEWCEREVSSFGHSER